MSLLLVLLICGVVVFVIDLICNRFVSQNRFLNALITALGFGVVAFLTLVGYDRTVLAS